MTVCIQQKIQRGYVVSAYPLLLRYTIKSIFLQNKYRFCHHDKNIRLKSPTAWGTEPPNVGFYSPRQGENFQSCIFGHQTVWSLIDYIPPTLQLSGYTSGGDGGENWDISSLQDRFEGLAQENIQGNWDGFSNRLLPLFPLRSFHLCQSQ